LAAWFFAGMQAEYISNFCQPDIQSTNRAAT
jgi:hypothetical protein